MQASQSSPFRPPSCFDQSHDSRALLFQWDVSAAFDVRVACLQGEPAVNLGRMGWRGGGGVVMKKIVVVEMVVVMVM